MKQLSFEWAEEPELDEQVEIELLPAVSESVLAAIDLARLLEPESLSTFDAAEAALADVLFWGALDWDRALAADVARPLLAELRNEALAFDATGLLVTPLAISFLLVRVSGWTRRCTSSSCRSRACVGCAHRGMGDRGPRG